MSSTMSRFFSVMCFLTLTASPSLADAQATISGTVFGPGGTRLPGALITLIAQASGEVARVTAGQQGVYRASPALAYRSRAGTCS